MIHVDIVGLADIHGDVRAVRKVGPELRNAHMVLLIGVIGDITHFGRAKDASSVIDAVAALNPRILAVPGNCDHPEVSEYLAERGVSLEGRPMIVDGVGFMGVGGSLPCPGGATPNEIGEEQFERALADVTGPLPPGMPLILVSHQPPYDTKADAVIGGRHVGSTSVRQFIRDRQPLLCFAGHIHEGRGIDTIGVCQVINPGPLREGRYAWAMLGETVSGPTVTGCEIRNV